MYLHKYKDYEDYKYKQTLANKKKINLTWADPIILHIVADFVMTRNPDVAFGLCHGTRRGVEQMQLMQDFRFFGKEVEVLGTEISDTATQFPCTIEWDFHDVKDEWLNNVDFIYSNSIDHSYDPPKCLDAWMSCLNEAGVCILEWGDQHGKLGPNDKIDLETFSTEPSERSLVHGIIKEALPEDEQRETVVLTREIDPFVASLDEYKNIIEKKYDILDIIENKREHHPLGGGRRPRRESTFIFIKNREK